jgi:hypothetical protein
VLAAAAAAGLCLGLLKGNSAGLRGAVGNLSAPWLLIGVLAGFGAVTTRAGAARGLAATLLALLGFYVALTLVLGDQLGHTGVVGQLRHEVLANRVYFVFGACTGPFAGAFGAWLTRRPSWLAVAAGALVAGELAVVAVVQGRQLLPRPLYFAWGVDDWRPYVAECVSGLAVLVFGLWRRRSVVQG